MPSASSKTENKVPLEVQDPFKAAQNVVEKKLRNLEKRKGKIEIIREKRDQGEDINADQQKAIDCYEGVLTSLEVTRDLQKQLQEIQTEIDKYAKKKVRLEKKERADKRAADVRRTKDILELQSLLDCMGTESVRDDFKTGKHKAKVLTEDNLNQLDEFYKLISPSRDDEKYQEHVDAASEHLFSYLEAREAEAAGTSYKDLRNLAGGILNCGYFDGYPYEEESDKTDALEPAAEPQADIEAHPTKEEQLHDVAEVRPEEPVSSMEQQLQQHVPHSHPALPTQAPTQLQTPADMLPPQLNNVDNGGPQYPQADEDSYFSVAGFPNNQRPFQDIVSSVQGTFNFLQESQISSESAHMDPAVVAAQPMHKSSTDVLHGGSFQGVNMLGEDQLSHLTNQQQSSPQQAAVMVEHRAADPSQSPLDSSTSYNPHSQDYSQNLISQSTYSAEQSNPSLVGHSHSAMDQAVVLGAPDMPPSIPLPNQSTPTSSSLQDQTISQENQEKKPFAMNPNAAMFQSMYSNSVPAGHSQSGGPPHMTANNNASPSQIAPPMAGDKPLPHNDYTNGFGGASYSSRSGNGGAPRGGAMRGGSGGRGRGGGMSNGYARTSSRGGGYNAGRGGSGNYSSSRGAGGRGGGGGGMRGGPARGGSSERGGRGSSRGGYGSRPN